MLLEDACVEVGTKTTATEQQDDNYSDECQGCDTATESHQHHQQSLLQRQQPMPDKFLLSERQTSVASWDYLTTEDKNKSSDKLDFSYDKHEDNEVGKEDDDSGTLLSCLYTVIIMGIQMAGPI